MLSPEQIQARHASIGGSDIGAVLGVNQYRSALDVFNEKTGRVMPADLSDNQRVHFGNVLEDIVAQEYGRRHGVNVRRRNLTTRHSSTPWMTANIDRSVDGERKVLECKTADAWTYKNWGPDGTDQVPDSYLLQCAWYMSVLGYDLADLAVLIGGNDFRTYYFERDHDLEEMVVRKAGEFWFGNVIAGVPPAPTCDRDLATLYARDEGSLVVATPEIAEEMQTIANLKADINRLEKALNGHLFAVKSFMGGSMEVLNEDDGTRLATWKSSKDGETFDKADFKKQMPALYESYCSTKVGARPFLTKIKAK